MEIDLISKRWQVVSKEYAYSVRLAIVIVLSMLAPLSLVTAQIVAPTASTNSTSEEATGSSKMAIALQRNGDLTLRQSTLEGALFTISKLWDINIVAGNIEGSVNGVFKDAPLQEILDSILLSNGYSYRQVGESLVISELKLLGQVNPFFVSETIPVGVADVNEVVGAAQLLTTPQGKIQALPAAGALLVVDFPDRVEKIRALVKQIDAATRGLGSAGGSLAPRKLEVAYFKTHFIAAIEASQALNVVLSPEGRVAAIDGEDRLIIVDYDENLRMVESVLARIDRARPQVNIKALIYDISLSDIEEIGVNWNLLSSGTTDASGAPISGSGVAVNSVTKTAFDAASAGSSFTFFNLNSNFNINAVVLALQQATDSRLLASPNVTVMDNEQANIESISEIPFQQLTQTSAGGQIGTTSFKEAGIKLGVLPKISRDGTIGLTVTPEFSSLVGFTPGDNQPIIDTRRATTRVRVQDGQTLMIAGLRQRNDVGDFNGIPLMKDVKFLGHLFRARETQISESELVVFLTPEIVGVTGPHGERNQLTADTIRCRLDNIPVAEGCPDCNGEGECSLCESETSSSYVPQGHEEYISSPPVETLLPTPVEASEIITPSEQVLQITEPLTQATPSVQPEAKMLRRLPSIDGSLQSAPLPPPTSVQLQTSEEKSSLMNNDPLRVDYGSRFRAKGDVYRKPADEQADESTDQPASDEEVAKKPKSWADRLFFR